MKTCMKLAVLGGALLALSFGAQAADPVAPGFVTYAPPAGTARDSGEPSIGYNPKLHHAMYVGGFDPVFQVSFPDEMSPPQPANCPAQWKNVDTPFADGATLTFDPILFTDQNTGRTFVSQLIEVTSRYAYSDDDGATWTPGQLGGLPNGGIDHQTVGSGPYPASLPLGTPANLNAAVYYCSQNGYATCQRSDDGGLTFGPGTPAFNGITDGCSQYHGHIKVAPDGAAYLPNAACGDKQVVSVSENAGVSWELRPVTPSTPTPGKWDPSVAVGKANTIYYCRGDADGHVRIAASKDHGKTWFNDFDVGAAFKIENVAFPEAVAGDDDRAACAFLGTTVPGNYEAQDFPGVWYGYVAQTFDGGKTWTTSLVTPNDPVQREGGICISGTGCSGGNRNLLDFNEVTIDDKGRVLFGYADGCTGNCADFSGDNKFESEARITRQVTGKTLFAQFDGADLAGPKGSCPAGTAATVVAAAAQETAKTSRFGGALNALLLLPLLGLGLLRRRRV